MKNFKRLTAILIYIFIMSSLLGFEFFQLFDLKQMALVLIGMLILFLPGYKRGESIPSCARQLARCAIFASYIQTFILLFGALSTQITLEQLPREAALSCRPLLYGICLWVILSNESQKNAEPDAQKTSAHSKPYQPAPFMEGENKTAHENLGITASEAYEAFRKSGLTNRESEIALQICKGLSNAEIAAELSISETTVKKHISNIFYKLEIERREQVRLFVMKSF